MDVIANTLGIVFGSGGGGATVPTFQLLNAVQQGAGFYNRIGKAIRMKSVEIKFQIYPTARAANSAGLYARVMLVYDRNANGAVAAWADLNMSWDQTGLTTASTVFDFRNPVNTERFVVLRDQLIALPATVSGGLQSTALPNINSNCTVADAGAVSGSALSQHWYVKLKGLETMYSQNTNPQLIGGISTGALYLVVASNDGTASPNGFWQLFYGSRLRFYDN